MTTELHRKLVWLLGVRLAISTLFLGWATVVQVRAPGTAFDPFFFLIGLTYGLSVIYALTLRMTARHGWLADVQLAADAMIVSAFIAVTGGVSSYFPLLYVLPIIAASLLGGRRGALMVATLSAVIYSGVVVVQYQEGALQLLPIWLRQPLAAPLPAHIARYTVAINVFAFAAVALLSGSLAEKLKRAGASLEQASTEIANLQAFNQHVIDSLTSGLISTDHGLRILTFNHAAEHITGLPASAAIGQYLPDILQVPGDLLAALEADLPTGRTRRVECPYVAPDGRTLDIGMNGTHLNTPEGRAGFLFNFQDVTDIKKLEREAGMQHRLAAVGEMAAGIAHEIRNPLASISGSIQILKQELALSSDQAQLMDIVVRESERLNGIIKNFLAYARPQRFAVKRLDLARVVLDTALLLRNSADVRQGHEVATDVPGHEVWYEADEGQIRQVLWNLATNGLRAMPSGGRLRLGVRYEPVDEAIDGHPVLEVEDQGVGIPPEELDAIFQPFHGAFAKGTGLGLAIVHRIVSDYNGEIQVTSRPGAGTVVRVRLPVTQSSPSPASAI